MVEIGTYIRTKETRVESGLGIYLNGFISKSKRMRGFHSIYNVCMCIKTEIKWELKRTSEMEYYGDENIKELNERGRVIGVKKEV